MNILLRTIVLSLATVAWLAADTVRLRSGRQVEGTFIGGDSRQVRFLVSGGNIENFDITEVESISFGKAASQTGATTPAPAASRTSAAAASKAAANSAAPSAPASGRVVVPAGSVITVRMIDAVDSDSATTGEKFRASLDDPIVVNEKTVAPRGADVTVQLVRVEQSGKLTGRDEVALDLFDITVNGKSYPVSTSYAEVQSESRTGQTGKVVGGGAALGAIIGAIAGGGKGAAIGAATGAGAGTAVQVLTRGPKVKIPSESRLDFTLKQPLVIE